MHFNVTFVHTHCPNFRKTTFSFVFVVLCAFALTFITTPVAAQRRMAIAAVSNEKDGNRISGPFTFEVFGAFEISQSTTPQAVLAASGISTISDDVPHRERIQAAPGAQSREPTGLFSYFYRFLANPPNLAELLRSGGTIELAARFPNAKSTDLTLENLRHRLVITEIMWGLNQSAIGADQVKAQWIEVYIDGGSHPGANTLEAQGLILLITEKQRVSRIGQPIDRRNGGDFNPDAVDAEANKFYVVDMVSLVNRFGQRWEPPGSSGRLTPTNSHPVSKLVSMYRKRQLNEGRTQYESDTSFGDGSEADSWAASVGRINMEGPFIGTPGAVQQDDVGQVLSTHSRANLIQGGPLREAALLEDPEPNDDSLREDRGGVDTWIMHWYGPDGNYEESGGYAISAPIDLIARGTGGALNQVSLSTLEGVLMTQDIDMEWGNHHGGTRGWEVFEIGPADTNNMNRGDPTDYIDTYALIVIDSPRDMSTVMSPAHDDHAQIWINGEKWYNNSRWTGGAQTILHDVEIELKKGANVLLYRCSESGGKAYFNLHLDDATHAAVTIYPKAGMDKQAFLDAIRVLQSGGTPTRTPQGQTQAKLSFAMPAEVSVGETLTATLNITDVVDLAGVQFDLHFNPAVLEVKDIQEGDLLTGVGAFFQVLHFATVPGEISGIRIARTGGVDGSGVLLKVVFTAKGVGNSELAVRNLKVGTSTGAAIPTTIVSGKVAVASGNETSFSPDVTGDGKVNILDLVLVSRHFGPAAAAPPGVDINGDGEVDIFDLILVAQHLGGANTSAAPAQLVRHTGLDAAKVQGWLSTAYVENDGSLAFAAGIANLEKLLSRMVPTETAVYANYPNPFNPETWIPYQLAEAADVTLTIYAMNGNVVRTLTLGYQPVGIYQGKGRAAYWDGRNALGESVASGVYFCTFTAGDFTATRKMLIRK